MKKYVELTCGAQFSGGSKELQHFFLPEMVLVFLILSDPEKERAVKERHPKSS